MRRMLVLSLMIGGTLCTSGHALRFVAYGDTRQGGSLHQQNIAQFLKFEPDLVLNLGDIWEDNGSLDFDRVRADNPKLSDLWDRNRYLVARGNHESEQQVLGYRPTVLRGGNILYSFTVDNVFFLCTGLDLSLNSDLSGNAVWIEEQLKSPAARNATWRIVYAHRPMLCAGSLPWPPAGGDWRLTTFGRLCEEYGVTMTFAGHAHNYQRSHLMRRTTVVNKGNDHPEGEGTVHIVSGGGGCGLTFVESAPWQATNAYTHHFCALTATGDSLEMVVRKPDGAVIDRVVFRTSSTAVKRVSIGTPSRKGSREPRAVGSGNSSLLDVGGALTSNSSVLFYSVDGRRIAGGAAPAQQRVGLGNVMARGLYIVVVKTGGARVMSILAVP